MGPEPSHDYSGAKPLVGTVVNENLCMFYSGHPRFRITNMDRMKWLKMPPITHEISITYNPWNLAARVLWLDGNPENEWN